jgi:tRNA nucleotidyltransferase (CCA-adding enzyme)
MNLIEKYKNNISVEIQKILDICSVAAEKLGIKIFLVGGIVRDLLLDKSGFDVDITVEGDAINFVKFLELEFSDTCRIKSLHDDFKTAKMVFNNEIEIDFASTRTEFYETPAALPTLKEAGVCLKTDIKRRDFTINAMAMSLNKSDFGTLIDYTNGFSDLQNKILRIFHPQSFTDDPTRIIRGLKFRVRFDCEMDSTTKNLQEECLKSGMFDMLGGERIKSELKQTLNLNNPKAFDLLVKENIYRLLNPYLITNSLPDSYKIAEIIDENASEINKDFIWLIYLSILLGGLELDKISQTISKLNISSLETGVVLDYKDILQNQEKLKGNISRFEIYDFFVKYSHEAILAFKASCEDSSICEKTSLFFSELQHISLFSTGKTLINIGFIPGPTFSDILKELHKNKINGLISTKEQEISFLKNLAEKSNLN